MEKDKTSKEWTSKNDSGGDLWRWDDGGVCVSPVSVIYGVWLWKTMTHE